MGRAGTTQRLLCRDSGLQTAKPHRRARRRRGNPTGEVVEVNQAVVRGRTVSLPGEISPVRAGEKSAEVIVVGKRAGVRMHSKIAGSLSR